MPFILLILFLVEAVAEKLDGTFRIQEENASVVYHFRNDSMVYAFAKGENDENAIKVSIVVSNEFSVLSYELNEKERVYSFSDDEEQKSVEKAYERDFSKEEREVLRAFILSVRLFEDSVRKTPDKFRVQ